MSCEQGWAAGLTRRQACRAVSRLLRDAGCDSPDFDAGCLVSWAADCPRSALLAQGDTLLSSQASQRLETVTAERAARRPLQYIVGSWGFLDLTLDVGEGVLIPRPDTELLCETAAAYLTASGCPAPTVYDLCAGSGCVGLGIASLTNGTATVTAVELSPDALRFLRRNCARYACWTVTPVQADVLREAGRFDDGVTAIVSNPPYIPSDDLSSLMPEVQREPRVALDGGDGLRFYRAIARDWVPKLCPGGLCAVEVGRGQAEAVAVLWRQAGLTHVEARRDLAGIARVVTGIRGV